MTTCFAGQCIIKISLFLSLSFVVSLFYTKFLSTFQITKSFHSFYSIQFIRCLSWTTALCSMQSKWNMQYNWTHYIETIEMKTNNCTRKQEFQMNFGIRMKSIFNVSINSYFISIIATRKKKMKERNRKQRK